MPLCLDMAYSRTLYTAEQDISKHESAEVAPGPGPGASQCSFKEETLGTGLMKGETPREVLDKLIRINNHGASFLGIDTGREHGKGKTYK